MHTQTPSPEDPTQSLASNEAGILRFARIVWLVCFANSWKCACCCMRASFPLFAICCLPTETNFSFQCESAKVAKTTLRGLNASCSHSCGRLPTIELTHESVSTRHSPDIGEVISEAYTCGAQRLYSVQARQQRVSGRFSGRGPPSFQGK